MVSEPKPDLPPLPSPNSTTTPPSLPPAPAATPSYPMLNPSSPLPKMPPTSLTPPHSTSMATASSKSAVPATAAATTAAPSPFCGSSLTVRRNPLEKQEVNSSNFKPISSSSNRSPGIRPNVSSIPSPQVGPEPVLEYYCNLCLDNCSYKRYHCNTLRNYDLCLSCFAYEGLELGLTPLDFNYREDEEKKFDVLEYWCNHCFTNCTDEHYRCNKFLSYHLFLACFTNEEFEFGLTPRDFIHVKAVEEDSRPAIEASKPHHYPSDNAALVEDGVSAGSSIRPLAVNPTAKNTESISRDHIVCEDFPGLVTVTSGKWTTYRSMTEDAAIRSAKLKPANSCVTKNLSIVGGDLHTLGRLDYVKRLSHSFTVHPKVDLFIDEVLTFGYSHSPLYVICRVISKGGVMHDPSNETGPNFDLEFKDDVHEEAMLATAHDFGGHFPSQVKRLMYLYEVEKDIEGVEVSIHESLMAVTFATLSEKKEDGSSLLLRPEENALRMRMGVERMCMPAPSVEQFVDVVNATVLADKRWVPPAREGSMFKHWVPILVGVRRQLDLEMIVSSVFGGSADFSYTSESKFQLYRILEGLLQQFIPLQWTEPARAELLGWFLDALGTITSDLEGGDVFTKIERQPGVKFEHIYAPQPVDVAKSAGSQAAEVSANASDSMILVFRTQVEQPLSSLGLPPVHLIVKALAKAARYTDIKRRSLLSSMENSQGKMLSLNNHAEMFKLIGNWLIWSESYIEAINIYTCAIARCEKNAVYYCNKIAAFTHMQRYTEAIHNCVKVIEVGPNKKCLLDALNENLKHSNAQIQCVVLEALKHFGDRISSNVTLRYLKFLDDSNVAASLHDQEGGNVSAWIWCKTIALLEDNGFKVTAIDFAGSGPDCFDTNDITSLAQCVNPLTSFLEKLGDEEKVILGGHDFGGAYISFAMKVFSQVDLRLLRVVAIGHSIDVDAAIEFVISKVVPAVSDSTWELNKPTDTREIAVAPSSKDEMQYTWLDNEEAKKEKASQFGTSSAIANDKEATEERVDQPRSAIEVRHFDFDPGGREHMEGISKLITIGRCLALLLDNLDDTLELLDLCFNDLIGSIPQSLSKLSFLSKFSVAHNFLVGEIPTSGQFFSFSNSSFEGNVGLCSVPNSCDRTDVTVGALLQYIGQYQVSFGPISWLMISLSGDEDCLIDLEDKINLRGKD